MSGIDDPDPTGAVSLPVCVCVCVCVCLKKKLLRAAMQCLNYTLSIRHQFRSIHGNMDTWIIDPCDNDLMKQSGFRDASCEGKSLMAVVVVRPTHPRDYDSVLSFISRE